MPSLSAFLGSANVLLALVSAIVCTFFVVRLRRGMYEQGAREIVFGIILVSGGLAVHRTYWALNRVLEAHGSHYLLTALYKDYAWFTLVPLLVIIAGYGQHLSPVLRRVWGSSWPQYYGTGVFTLFMAIAWIF